MTTDANYQTDTARQNGVSNGVADPLSFNKALHQATIIGTAFAQFIANQGISVDDTNLANLVAAFQSAIASGSGATYADRVAHAFFAQADIGQMDLCRPQTAPAAATYAAGDAGNLSGDYRYREVFVTGYVNANGSYFVSGFSPAASRSSTDVSPSSQRVSITNLPIGTAGCIGRAIYRSAAGGATGSEQFCGIIWDNATTTYTDNKVDSQLGAGIPAVQGTAIPAAVPTANTTGTNLCKWISAALPAAWSSSAPYTESVNVAGVHAADKLIISPVYDSDPEIRQAQREAWNMVVKIDVTEGAIIATCDEDVPAVIIPIQIEVIR